MPVSNAPADPAESTTSLASNPLLETWNTPFGAPPFGSIQTVHFLPAIKEAMANQIREVETIAGEKDTPTFANTVEALEQTGELLDKVNSVFSNLTSAETTDELQAIAKEIAPLRSAHQDAILLNESVFKRIKVVWDGRANASLTQEQSMLLERTYRRFVRNGALLDDPAKERLRKINSEMASLGVKFADNLLKEMNDYRLVIEKKEDLTGLPERLVLGAAETARKDKLDGKWIFTLHAPSLWPFLQYADNRELRGQIFDAYITRGAHAKELANATICSRMASLRAERARLLGYDTWADFVLEENMAGTPARVYDLLNQLWEPAKRLAAKEAADLRQAIKDDGKNHELEPCDWFYYAEKVRQKKFAIDESAIRPYFRLENVIQGAFQVANKLYGITFTEVTNVPVYHSEVKVFEVKDADGSHLALFYADYFPRPGKRSGAWSSRYRGAWVKNGQAIRPLVINVGNFSRPAGNAPALLSIDEVETLFHELGHGLHSILSRVSYRTLGGTPRDFVELPSQIMENWALEPEVLKLYAKHWKTGDVIPEEMITRLKQAERFNQGFKTVEYLAASLLDLEWHTLPNPSEPDAAVLERIALARMGMPSEIVPRYRSPYFQHIFGGAFDYSAGYYSYIWAEVLDSDAFGAFKEKGLFDQATAKSFRQNILEKGWSEDPMRMFEKFRGRKPQVGPLLEKRGLAGR